MCFWKHSSKTTTATIVFLAILPGQLFASTTEDQFAESKKLVKKYCLNCHSRETAEADLRIDSLLESKSFETELHSWKEIKARLESRYMLPKGKPRPSEAEYEEAVAKLGDAIERIEQEIASKRPRAMRRLNRDEYANTIRDLFGIRFRPGDDFPSDGTLNGFDTATEGLSLSPALVEKYISVSSEVLERALRPEEPSAKPRSNLIAFDEERDNYPPGIHPMGHVDFKDQPLSNLYVRMLQAAGMQVTKFSDSTVPLSLG